MADFRSVAGNTPDDPGGPSGAENKAVIMKTHHDDVRQRHTGTN